jgi:hypothetical protein
VTGRSGWDRKARTGRKDGWRSIRTTGRERRRDEYSIKWRRTWEVNAKVNEQVASDSNSREILHPKFNRRFCKSCVIVLNETSAV